MLKSLISYIMQCLLLTLIITSVLAEREIPKDFEFGVTTSAYQYEGAWNEDGRGKSIWDVAVHQTPEYMRSNGTGDVATDFYHHYKQDVQIMRDLGLDFFRFSFSWTRILPTGFANNINQAGIDYYNDLIDELIKHNITPRATIYHWDLPQNLQNLGGWTNPNIVQWFEDYAKVLYDNFGHKVKMWTTINEPLLICVYGYGILVLAPFVLSPGVGEYMCVKNTLLAHARAYHLYHEYYNDDGKGQVGIALNPVWSVPETQSEEDKQAAMDVVLFSFSIIVNPILSQTGDFPEKVKRRVQAKSYEQGFKRSRLPELTEEEIEAIRGTADFLGLNYYYTSVITKNPVVGRVYPVPSFVDDIGVGNRLNAIWPTKSFYQSFAPSHFYDMLMAVKNMYNITLHITENGWTNDGRLNDDDRVEYLCTHVAAILDARDNGCDVRDYSVWSLLDTFEWSRAYSKKFGLYNVDFSSPNLTRTPRKSALFYKNMIQTRTIKDNL